MGKKTKKLSLKKETVRKLDTLSDEQLKGAAGAADYLQLNYNYNYINWGYGNYAVPYPTRTCGCEPSGAYC